MNPKLTPCFSLKDSLYFFLNSKIGDISTSLKVVSIAVSFLAETNRSATFLRSIESFLRVTPLSLVSTFLPIDGTAFIASSFVIRPSFPVPITSELIKFFSASIFFAAGLADPEAYVDSEGLLIFASFFKTFLESEALESELSLGLATLVSIKQTTDPTSTASPSLALRVIVPLSSAGNSNVALSLSTSAIA